MRKDFCKFHELLRILDSKPLRVETKETYYSAAWNESHSQKLNGKSDINIDCRIPINKKTRSINCIKKCNYFRIICRIIII